MAEPVGITGTALTVASLLYSSCQTVCEIIDSYKKAPKEYQDLTLSLRTLQNSLGTLRNSLQGTGDAPLSQEQRDSLVDLALPLEICNAACEDFKSKLSKLTSNSTIDHTAFWDKLRLHFNKNDVAFLEGKLSSAKSTVIMALGVLSL